MKIIFLLLPWLIQLSQLSLAAPTPIVSLASLPALVRRHNPELRAQKIAIQEAQANAIDASRLSNPELEFSTAVQRTRLSQAEVAYFQKIPLSDKRKLTQQLANLGIDEAELSYEMLVQDTISRAESSLYQAAFAREKSSQLQTFLAQQREFHTALAQAAQQGEIPVSDTAELEIAIQQTQSEITQSQLLEQLALSQLTLSLGLPQNSPLSLHLPPLLPLAIPKALTQTTLAEQRATLSIRSAQISLSRARAERIQDVEVGAFTSISRTEDAPIGSREESMVGVKVRVPLAIYSQNRGAIAAATAREQRAIAQKNALSAQLQQQRHAQILHLRAAIQQYEFFSKNQISNIDQQLVLAKKSYLEGLSPIQNILRLQEQRRLCLNQILDTQRNFFLARQLYLRIGQINSESPTL